MGRFTGLSGIKTNAGSLYFLYPGNYVVDLEEVKFFNNRKGIDTFIVEAKVIASDNPDRLPGMICSQVISFKNPDAIQACLGDIKQFVGAALGIVDPNSYVAEIDPTGYQPGTQVADTPEAATDRFWEEATEAFIAKEQPGRGARLHLNCYKIMVGKDKDQPFTKHRWAPGFVQVSAEPVVQLAKG